jgi:hypothetical protein
MPVDMGLAPELRTRSGNPACRAHFEKDCHHPASNGRLKTIRPFDRGEDAMGSTVISLTHTLKAKTPKVEFQVTAAIAAVLCAALTANIWLPPQAASAPAPLVIDREAAAELLEATFTDEGFRLRPTYPVEFAAVYGLAADKPYTALAAAEWSTAAQSAPKTDQAAPPLKAQKKTTLVAQACAGECAASAAHAAVLPPPRPSALAPVQVAETAPVVEDKRVRLLGVSLPGFVPSGDKIAKTVVSWGGSIAGVIPGL